MPLTWFLSQTPATEREKQSGQAEAPLGQLLMQAGEKVREQGKGLAPALSPDILISYSALDRPAPPLVSLIMAWAAAMRAMGMRMGEQDT